MGLVLYILAVILFVILYPIAYLYMIIYSFFSPKPLVRIDKIHKKVAIEIDELGNLMFSDLLNYALLKSDVYKFGFDEETISSVLGKNKQSGTLTFIGKALADLLNFLDHNHVEKSIKP